MNDYNSKLINNVKLYASNDDELIEEKYSFLKYFIEKTEEDECEVNIINEEYEDSNANVDGYYYDVDSKTYFLYIVRYSDVIAENAMLTEKEVQSDYDKIINFVKYSISKKFSKFVPETITSDLCYDISKNINSSEIVVNYITNYNIPKALKRNCIMSIDALRNILINTFDINDLKEKITKNEEINNIISCPDKFGQRIDALLISSNEDLDTYMFYMKGIWLAQLYKEDGARLLEPNCRSYLKRTAKVNAGILETVKDSPELFVSYNNGLSAVASSVKCEVLGKNHFIINEINDFQIVNGGQTTATLAECLKDGLRDELTIVRVPVKLSVIKNVINASKNIGNISVYSNTQTAIKKSDPPSNLPYYITLKHLSNKCLSMDKNGNNYICYFERTSGEYTTELRRNNNSVRFQKTCPKDYKFNKLDLALSINSWQQLPHVVSNGREKNFIYFNNIVKRQNIKYDEDYFKKAYATLILFKETDKLAKKLKVTVKRNVVTYTIALLSKLTNQRIDLLDIWENKHINDTLKSALLTIIPKVHTIISKAPITCPEPRMWARKEECWNKIANLNFNIESIKQVEKTDFYPVDEDVEYADNVENLYDGTLWDKVLEWNRHVQIYTQPQLKFLWFTKTLSRSDYTNDKKKKLTKKQIIYLKDLYILACNNGFKRD